MLLALEADLHEEEDHLARDIAADAIDVHVAPACHPAGHNIQAESKSPVQEQVQGCMTELSQTPVICAGLAAGKASVPGSQGFGLLSQDISNISA